MDSQTSDPRAVNNLLHTLRGEQFRHSQNLIRSRTHLSSAVAHNSPTLPVHFTSLGRSTRYDIGIKKADHSKQSALRSCPGPGPPKSWTQTPKDVLRETARRWRAEALSLIFSHIKPPPNVVPGFCAPSLTQLCLQKVIPSTSNIEFIETIVPFLPSHLRRDLVRYAAVQSPLSNTVLFALYEPEGHADGELIIVGPNATLRDDYFLLSSTLNAKEGGEVRDWDSEIAVPEPLCRFILISARLAISTLLTLPPTITHLALIDLPTSIPLHRLPGTCPMLVVLDLSYNTWLDDTSKDLNPFERVDWGRWSYLRILGLRACYISDELQIRVNQSRWDDVDII
ncbi:hypothetical protein BDZ94DRAFT_1243810, partial [Collybia nuda]